MLSIEMADVPPRLLLIVSPRFLLGEWGELVIMICLAGQAAVMLARQSGAAEPKALKSTGDECLYTL